MNWRALPMRRKVMLKQSISAFSDLNPEAARATMVMENEMEFDLDAIYAELMANSERGNAKNLLAVFVIFTHLKRVADQAKNLCEETVFAATGETKAPKVYNVLFVDEDNSCLSQIAEAFAAKTFPGVANTAAVDHALPMHCILPWWNSCKPTVSIWTMRNPSRLT